MQNSVCFIAVVSTPWHCSFPQEFADSKCVKFDNASWFACKYLLTWRGAWNVVQCFVSGITRFQEDWVTPHMAGRTGQGVLNAFHITDPLFGELTGPHKESSHKGHQCGALVFSFMFSWTTGWTYCAVVSDLRRLNSLRPRDAYMHR